MNDESLKQYAGLIDNEHAKTVRKMLDYFDGKQKKHMVELLNSYGTGRTNWQTRGIIPRYRNLTKTIVEKSGLLFTGEAPKLEVYTDDTEQVEDVEQTLALQVILDNASWIDTFINLDQVVRLTKTAALLMNYDAESDNLVFDILHRGNCEIVINENNREIIMVVYITGEYAKSRSFRIMTALEYVDFEVDSQGNVKNVTTIPNPYGFIPVTPFYDTQKPRMGFWVEAQDDLVSMNEMYNIHLTDAEFAAKWEKYPTLFTNLTPAGSQRNIETYNMGDTAPSTRSMLFGNGGTAPAGNVGGPDRMIQMDGQGVDNPFIDYKSPQVDLKSLDEVFKQWARDFAYDWSVRIKSEGNGNATSGFQLVVEEIDNLELRKMRQRMFEQGIERMFDVVRKLWNATHTPVFTDAAYLDVEFCKPHLPVDEKVEEEVWSIRIKEGRASVIDYFMSKGMTRLEAEEKLAEVKAYNAGQPLPPAPELMDVSGDPTDNPLTEED